MLKTTIFGLSALALMSLCTSGLAADFLADRHAANKVQCSGCHIETPPKLAVPTAQCQKCHGSYKDLAEKTKNLKPNPHYTHMLDQPCEECHRAHEPSVNMCASCHKLDIKVP